MTQGLTLANRGAMSSSSRIPGFYKLSPKARREALRRVAGLSEEDLRSFDSGALSAEVADLMVENVVGTFGMPLGVGVNLLINGRDVLVPMVVEEPSVVAAVSNMARLVRKARGFTASAERGLMIGQVQLVRVQDPLTTAARLEGHVPELVALANRIHPRLIARGGGVRGMEVRCVRYEEPGEIPEDMVVLHFHIDCVDAMGANLINTVAERLAPVIEDLTGEKVGLRILSNLASLRLARASCALPPEVLGTDELDGAEVAEGIASAYRFAWAYPWRAATHNKGVMNGIDAVALATGNDWRALEAGAHAWAARDGSYRSLTSWKIDTDGVLHGSIELPLQVGTVGGPIRSHPTVATSHKLLGNPRAAELAGIMAAVGLAQNLGALRALATEGIQRGHMRMHARQVAAQAGAVGEEIGAVVREMCAAGDWSHSRALHELQALRKGP